MKLIKKEALIANKIIAYNKRGAYNKIKKVGSTDAIDFFFASDFSRTFYFDWMTLFTIGPMLNRCLAQPAHDVKTTLKRRQNVKIASFAGCGRQIHGLTSRKILRKSSVEECIFDHTALHVFLCFTPRHCILNADSTKTHSSVAF